jgi:hypothetical protein
MAQRSHYWSCSKFADWLRGTPKLSAATSGQWRQWHRDSKTAHPFRHWLAEEALDGIQDFVNWPLDQIHSAKYYINNRWISRSHSLTAHPRDIRPGSWRDVGDRFLPCMFNELVDYVEVELAWWHLIWEGPEERKKYNMPWWAHGWWRVRLWRCRQAGLDNLAWQSGLVYGKDELPEDDPRAGQPTPQAENAKEILALYHWWTEVYPRRPDSHDESGWTQYCEERRQRMAEDDTLGFLDVEPDQEKREHVHAILDRSHAIEAAYKQEDTDMLIRLIRVRDSLWT